VTIDFSHPKQYPCGYLAYPNRYPCNAGTCLGYVSKGTRGGTCLGDEEIRLQRVLVKSIFYWITFNIEFAN
jgi:hypothetical protein